MRFPRHKWPKSWSDIEDPVVLLEQKLYGHQLAGLLDGKSTNWECLFVHRKRGLFLSICVDDIKVAGKRQNYGFHVEETDENVDLDEPTSFLDHVYLGCTQRECKPIEVIIDEYRQMIESRISAGATEKLLEWEMPHAKTVARSNDMEGHAQKMR